MQDGLEEGSPCFTQGESRETFWDVHTEIPTPLTSLGHLLHMVLGIGAGKGVCDNLVFLELPSLASYLGLRARMRKCGGSTGADGSGEQGWWEIR